MAKTVEQKRAHQRDYQRQRRARQKARYDAFLEQTRLQAAIISSENERYNLRITTMLEDMETATDILRKSKAKAEYTGLRTDFEHHEKLWLYWQDYKNRAEQALNADPIVQRVLAREAAKAVR